MSKNTGKNTQPVEAVLVGAGGRGRDAFGAFAKRTPELLKFIAVAEPDEGRRRKFASDHGIAESMQFASWSDLVTRPAPLAPLCFNATLDREHLPSSLAILEAGYHLFLEKPMGVTAAECLAIERKAAERDRMVQICHPLRFTTFYGKVKSLIEEGAIGRPITIAMSENIAYWHYAHSYVRGNWRRVDTTGPMILTKCCHDMDIATWLCDARASRVASVGALRFFRPENAPAGAPKRCLDGCPAEKTCPFYAPALYLGDYAEWPVSAISLDTSLEARRRAIETGPYGRCVFHSDNSAVDHQEVIAEFENGIQVNFSARANSFLPLRTIRIIGTEGELNGHFEKQEISTFRFKTGMWYQDKPKVYRLRARTAGAHGGGDEGAIRNFLRCYKENDQTFIRRSLEIAVEAHVLALAAEEARATGAVVDMSAYRKKCKN